MVCIDLIFTIVMSSALCCDVSRHVTTPVK